MTGPEHYLEAEQLLGAVEKTPDGWGEGAEYARQELAAAQVHATLALAAAAALPAILAYWGGDSVGRSVGTPREWAEVAS